MSGHTLAVHELLKEYLAKPYDPGRDTPLRAGLVRARKKGAPWCSPLRIWRAMPRRWR